MLKTSQEVERENFEITSRLTVQYLQKFYVALYKNRET